MNNWFQLRGKLTGGSTTLITIIGFIISIIVWWILAEVFSKNRPVVEGYNTELPSSLDANNQFNRDSILRVDSIKYAQATTFEKVYPLLPRPDQVLKSFPVLFSKDKLVSNTLHSVWLNIQGYFWAILLSIPIGFMIGLFPIFKGLFSKQVDALRYLPLSALTGLFIIWFGLGDPMKIAFLAVGILVYLIPVVVTRLEEIDEVYVQTAYTMGASRWQLIKNVFYPGIMTKLMDDIRVLTAISWTYIIIAELLNKETGIGALIYTKARQGQIDRVFALLLVIIIIGLIQDKIFILIDRVINPQKYYKLEGKGLSEGKIGLYAILTAIVAGIVCSSFIKISALCTFSLIMAAAGFIALIYAYFVLNKTQSA